MKHRSLDAATGALALLLLLAAAPALAQRDVPRDFCQDRGELHRGEFVDLRQTTLRPTRSLSVDAAPNGGVSVQGWARDEVRVCARVEAHAGSDAGARELASRVRVTTDGGEIRADGPRTDRDRSWSVSFEVLTPERTDLSLHSTNGGLSVTEIHGRRMELATTNGGIHLEDVGGDVRGETTNGGIHVELTGDRWVGEGLDLRTTNGGVRVEAPRDFGAHLVASTVNGGIDADVPVQRGRWTGGRVDADLGRGGPTLHITTTNGGIHLEDVGGDVRGETTNGGIRVDRGR